MYQNLIDAYKMYFKKTDNIKLYDYTNKDIMKF